MKWKFNLIIIFALLLSFGIAQAESPIKGFIAEPKKSGKVNLSWTNAQKEKFPKSLIVGSDEEIEWTPEDGKKYKEGEKIDEIIEVIAITQDIEFTTELVTEKRYKYYQAFAFNENLQYSEGKPGSEKTGMAIQITLVGMFVVFAGLILLVFSVVLLGRAIEGSTKKHAEIKKKIAEKKEKKKLEQKPHPQAFQKIPEQPKKDVQKIPPEVIAVISATIAAFMEDRKYNIKSIKRRDNDPWATLGRMESMTQQ